MQADRQDRNGGRNEDGRHTKQTLIIAIGILILVGGVYLLMPGGTDDQPEPIPTAELSKDKPSPSQPSMRVAPPEVQPDLTISEAPDIPEIAEISEPDEPQPEPAPEPVPPTPEELDLLFREAVADAGIEVSSALQSAVSAPYLLDRGISSADQLARGLVPRRTLNLDRPKGSFATTHEGMNYRIDPAGYARYDTLTTAIAALPAASIASLFHAYREQLESAYASLGYPADAMDNTMIAALDQVLSAPLRETPPELISKGAVWAYADSSLEASNDLHKQLLRAGPDNTQKLQRWAAELRSALLQP